MNRRLFLRTSALAGAACLADWQTAYARGTKDPLVGLPWPGWKPGQMQIHFIYTGVAESAFYILQEYWGGLPCPPPGDLPDPGIEPTSLISPALAVKFFTTSASWDAQ